MALLAEELVEEWLNRQGYFTIRGVKLGVDEVDLLALKFSKNGEPIFRHIEVQASMRPISYISRVPKAAQKLGRKANSAKRSEEELLIGVAEWVDKKFLKTKKTDLFKILVPVKWTSELVLNNVKSEQEVELIKSQGIKVFRLNEVIDDLENKKFMIKSASGSDFVDLIRMGKKMHNKFAKHASFVTLTARDAFTTRPLQRR